MSSCSNSSHHDICDLACGTVITPASIGAAQANAVTNFRSACDDGFIAIIGNWVSR